MKIAFASPAAVLALLTLLEAARADPSPPPAVLPSVTPLGNGLYQYHYTFTNNVSGAILNAFWLQPFLPSYGSDGKAITPMSDTQYSYYRDKYSSSPTSPILNPTPGTTMTGTTNLRYSGFLYWGFDGGAYAGLTKGQSATVSFVAPFPPGEIHDQLQYYYPDPYEGEGHVSGADGYTIGPVDNPSLGTVNTPEPAASLLAGLGVLGLAVTRASRFLSR